MYLIERLIALITYVLLLCIVCFIIAKLDKKKIGKILFVYLILLSTMAFFYIPTEGPDLYRLIPIMHIWSDLSFSELWFQMRNYTNPTYMLYMNLIGRMKIDGLLPAITCFLFYSNVFYIFKKCANKYKVSSSDVSLILFFFMSIGAFVEVISNIRTLLGFSIVAVCCYQEMIERKLILKNLIWYILASLLHPAVLALTIIRMGFLLIEKNRTSFQKFAKILFFGIILVGLYFYGETYLNASISKAKNYILTRDFKYFWEYLIGGISFLLIIKMEYMTFRLIKIEGDTGKVGNILRFCIVISFILVLFSFEYNIFHRFVVFLSIIALPIVFNLLEKRNTINIIKVNFRLIVFGISCLLLFIACARGNLCSLKFFIL